MLGAQDAKATQLQEQPRKYYTVAIELEATRGFMMEGTEPRTLDDCARVLQRIGSVPLRDHFAIRLRLRPPAR
jgi:hypothetical protein